MNRRIFGGVGSASSDVRPSPIAGQWYPGSPERLQARIEDFLSSAEVEPVDGRVVALIVPHAGHTYSGGVAAHAYRLVQSQRYDVVAIIAPNHRIGSSAPYLVTGHKAYWTPLGEVPLEQDLVAELDKRLGLSRVDRDEEHSLEIQLPFLQVALSDAFQLLPVMLNDQSADACRTLADALAEVLRGRNVLLVASTDLSHFFDAETAARFDGTVTERIAAFDVQGLLDVLHAGRGHACGGGPTAAVMLASRAFGADQATVLKYATSGDITGDYGSVVGYAAAALFARQS